ncbi:MAG: hypothetical protein JNL72_01885 [Flavipsychrobacter sp.]|nr:hypothetical protein [Flavipsychrobacter sp.]
MCIHRLIYPVILLAIVLGSCGKKKSGCTDPTADNFDLFADKDDGSCRYSNFLEGPFLYTGNRSGNGGTIQVQDSFTVEPLGNGDYRLVGLAGCNNIKVSSQNATWRLFDSDCGMQSFNCNFSGSLIFMSFSTYDGTNFYNYSGQARKL